MRKKLNGLLKGDVPLVSPSRMFTTTHTHPPVYHPGHSEGEVTDIMADESGKHFGPKIFDCFLEVKPTFQSIRRQVEGAGVPF